MRGPLAFIYFRGVGALVYWRSMLVAELKLLIMKHHSPTGAGALRRPPSMTPKRLKIVERGSLLQTTSSTIALFEVIRVPLICKKFSIYKNLVSY